MSDSALFVQLPGPGIINGQGLTVRRPRETVPTNLVTVMGHGMALTVATLHQAVYIKPDKDKKELFPGVVSHQPVKMSGDEKNPF